MTDMKDMLQNLISRWRVHPERMDQRRVKVFPSFALPKVESGRVGVDKGSRIYEFSIREADLDRTDDQESGVERHVILIDLNNFSSLDSGIIGVLIEAMQRVNASGGKLAIFGIRENVRQAFENAHLDQVFAIYSTREEALADQ
jgi:anti-anti-sigma regulatory factor